MPLIIDLPHVGESVVEGIIGKWLKQPGEAVRKYDPLVEVVTDKVTMEVPSPVSGIIARLLVEEGETVPMGAPILEIDTDETPEPVPPAPVETLGATTASAGGVHHWPSGQRRQAGGSHRRRYGGQRGRSAD